MSITSIEEALSTDSYQRYICRRQRPAIRLLLLSGLIGFALTMVFGQWLDPARLAWWIRCLPLAVMVVLTVVVWRTKNDTTLQLAKLAHALALVAGLLVDNSSRAHGLVFAAPALIILPIASSMIWLKVSHLLIFEAVCAWAMAMVLMASERLGWVEIGMAFYMALSLAVGGLLFFVATGLRHRNFELERKLNRNAYVDELTGLANRRRMLQVARRLFERCRADGLPLSVLYIDADRFKEINDRFGHDRGDQALRHLAGIIETHVRPADGVGRLGGEEFIAVLPGAALEEALQVAERIRAAAASSPLQELPITVSIGVASSQHHEDFRLVLNAADACVLAAKRQGRNRVEFDGMRESPRSPA
jgi:diguanylate cyclase (GGDEF)-like protein